jgi:hypothetical protein
MPTCLALLLLLCWIPIVASAQLPCSTPGSLTLDTMIVTATPCGSGGAQVTFRIAELPDAQPPAVAHWFVTVTRRSDGSIEYLIDATSLQFSGDCSCIDLVSTRDLFAWVSASTIAQGIADGHSSCGETVSVVLPSCVRREGVAASTSFESCEAGCCTRKWRYDCATQSASVLDEASSSCDPGIAATPCSDVCPQTLDSTSTQGLQ